MSPAIAATLVTSIRRNRTARSPGLRLQPGLGDADCERVRRIVSVVALFVLLAFHVATLFMDDDDRSPRLDGRRGPLASVVER